MSLRSPGWLYPRLLFSLLLLIVALSPRSAQAQPDPADVVSRRVIDAEHGTPLTGTNVIVDGTTWDAATDSSARTDPADALRYE